MQEFDIIRVLLYACCIMISLVTTAKQFRLEGIFGTSNKLISLGIFFIACSLLFQTIFSILGYQDPIWSPITQIVFLLLFVIGISFIFFGLWKISIFFEELRATSKKHVLSVHLDDESR